VLVFCVVVKMNTKNLLLLENLSLRNCLQLCWMVL